MSGQVSPPLHLDPSGAHCLDFLQKLEAANVSCVGIRTSDLDSKIVSKSPAYPQGHEHSEKPRILDGTNWGLFLYQRVPH